MSESLYQCPHLAAHYQFYLKPPSACLGSPNDQFQRLAALILRRVTIIIVRHSYRNKLELSGLCNKAVIKKHIFLDVQKHFTFLNKVGT